MPWTDAVHREITAALQTPELQRGAAAKPFITEEGTRRIWDHRLNGHTYNSEENDDPEISWPRDIAIPGKELLKVVSILVYIHWRHWSDFRSIFFDESGSPRIDRTDTALPFTLEALGKPHFLSDYANLFYDNQYVFLPILIKEDRDQVIENNNYRLPIIFESKDVDTGSYGEVTQVTIVRGQFRFAKDKMINGNEKILARKRIPLISNWQREVENLNILRGSRLGHKHIMQHVGTLRVGRQFNIFFEWADQDLAKFLQGDLNHEPKPLLQQVMQLASALHYLHHQIVSEDGWPVICCHMDLKPNNILVLQEQGYPVGKWMIADFGISVFKNTKVVSIRDQAANLTTRDSRNPPQRPPGPYQAPEVDQTWSTRSRPQDSNNSAQIGRKGDIWSLGCVFATVLAFALGRKAYVAELERARSTLDDISLENDRFYQPTRSDAYPAPKMVVKPEIERWLEGLLQKHLFEWVAPCVRLIRKTLEIDQENRPSAKDVEKELISILGLSFQPAPIIPPSPRQDYMMSGLLPAVDEIIEEAGEHSPSNVGITHLATPSTPEQEQTGTPSTSDTSQMPASLEPQDRSSRSSFSGSSWTFHESGKFTLNTEQYPIGRKAVVAICPSSERIVFSYNKGALLLCRDLTDSTGSLRFVINRVSDKQWRHVRLSGSLLVLRGQSNQPMEFVHLESQPLRRSTRLHDIDTRLLLGLDVSSRGWVVYRFDRSLKLFNSSSECLLEREIPDSRKEKYQTTSFNTDGHKLFACSWGHWYMWNLEDDRASDCGTGVIPPDQDFGRSNPIIIPFTRRMAFLLYDSKQKKIAAFPQPTGSTLSKACDILCGVITAEDNALISARARGKKYHLSIWSIQHQSDGSSVIRDEKPLFPLSLTYNKDFILNMALVRQARTSAVVVVSSNGEILKVNLDPVLNDGPT